MANFDGTDAYFDSREVIERIAELEAMHGENPFDPEFEDPNEPYDSEVKAEYEALIALREEAQGYIDDFQYGETFHTHDSLVEYTQEIVTESYMNNDLPSWVTNHIDWEAVTDEVEVDYTEFEFRGTTYYAR